ncbi:MAG TPA: hypothetical protein QF401_00800 [Candidatus Poseidoniaceae archaeon]|nr:hypothetical protein [Candidatus Poseidoniaceae archaeon]
MPGSPYLDEPPKYLTTWRRVLTFSIPSVLASIYLAVMFDVVFEMLVVFTALLALSAIIRK